MLSKNLTIRIIESICILIHKNKNICTFPRCSIVTPLARFEPAPAVQYDVASVYATRLANRPCPTPKRGLPLQNLHVSMTETIG